VTYPLVGGGDLGGPVGLTYGAVVVRADGVPSAPVRTRADVLAALREVRFSGWVARPDDGWVVAVAATGDGTVAAGRRGVVGVAEHLAGRLGVPVVALRVVADRQLLLSVWSAGAEVGRYVSDPSHGLPADDDTLPDPLGAEHAPGFAAACGHPDAAEDLAELLAEELDADSVIESERLSGVLRLLGLPRWIVAASSLPRDVPTGPDADDFVRLGAGAAGLAGRLAGRAASALRAHRPPPSPVPEAPRGGANIDPWMF
jgi:hypothetical protein